MIHQTSLIINIYVQDEIFFIAGKNSKIGTHNRVWNGYKIKNNLFNSKQYIWMNEYIVVDHVCRAIFRQV